MPRLGACGGFQHALIEIVRHVSGEAAADHAESNPDAELAVMTSLAWITQGPCSTISIAKPTDRAALTRALIVPALDTPSNLRDPARLLLSQFYAMNDA